jgi:hypothetical protein
MHVHLRRGLLLGWHLSAVPAVPRFFNWNSRIVAEPLISRNILAGKAKFQKNRCLGSLPKDAFWIHEKCKLDAPAQSKFQKYRLFVRNRTFKFNRF